MKRYLLFRSSPKDLYLMECIEIRERGSIAGKFIATTFKPTVYKFGNSIICWHPREHVLASDDLQECMDMLYLEML